MQIKIELENNETQEEADEKLLKALKGKKELKEKLGERYADDMINEFHDLIMEEHLNVLEDIKDKIQGELNVWT